MGLLDKVFGNKDGKPLVDDTDESIDIEEQQKNKRITGKIIRVDPRGFGFISSTELPFERIFFHWTSLKQNTLKFPELRKGMTVSFTAKMQVPEENGYKAIRISVEE